MNSSLSTLHQLFLAYPNTQASKATIAIYLRLLSDIPLDELRIVVDQCIAECKFLPTVAEVRDRWHSLTLNLGQLNSAEAWGMVTAEIMRIGSWGAPHFEDSRISQVVKAMGWLNICQSDVPGVDRAQFMRMFDQLAARDSSVQKLLPQARAMAAHRGLIPIGESLRALVGDAEKSPESAVRSPQSTADNSSALTQDSGLRTQDSRRAP